MNFWYRLVRYAGTGWSAMVVPIRALRWYRFKRYDGTVSPILSSNLSLIPKELHIYFFIILNTLRNIFSLYTFILGAAVGSNAFSACKNTKFLLTAKQNMRKTTKMLRKTTNAPEKNLSSPRRLAVDATNLSPGRTNLSPGRI